MSETLTPSQAFVMTRILFVLCAVLLSAPLFSKPASALDLYPLGTRNQSPLVQIFGLPYAETPRVLENGRIAASLSLNAASNFSGSTTGAEGIMLDGETYRYTLALRYGLGRRAEVGLDIPYVRQTGGFMDGFIKDWHNTFRLPQGGRDEAEDNQLAFAYLRDGETGFKQTEAGNGLGDIRLSGALQLTRQDQGNPATTALRLSFKLPTGDSDRLLGSGGFDLALALSGQRVFPAGAGRAGLFASLGVMGMTGGEVLAGQQRNVAGFGSLGLGWAPLDWLHLKLQLDGHTAFFDDSELDEVAADSAQLALGGTLALTEATGLDLAVVEDLVVDTAPDVVFHLALRHWF